MESSLEAESKKILIKAEGLIAAAEAAYNRSNELYVTETNNEYDDQTYVDVVRYYPKVKNNDDDDEQIYEKPEDHVSKEEFDATINKIKTKAYDKLCKVYVSYVGTKVKAPKEGRSIEL